MCKSCPKRLRGVLEVKLLAFPLRLLVGQAHDSCVIKKSTLNVHCVAIDLSQGGSRLGIILDSKGENKVLRSI